MSNFEDQTVQRSTFVSVIAWIFIILTGFASFVGIMQNIMVHIMFSEPKMQEAMNGLETAKDIPSFAHFMFSNVKVLVFLMFAMSLFTFISSIGLLKRKNWARKTFIVLLGLSIFMMLCNIVADFFFFPGPGDFGGEEISTQMKSVMNFMQIFLVIFYAGIATLLAWIIKKLLSPSIALEFQQQK